MAKRGRPKKKMSASELYVRMQELSGIKIGDRVKVLRTARENEMGWGCYWDEDMNNSIGKEFLVYDIMEDGIGLEDGVGDSFYPFFVLEVIKSGVSDAKVVEMARGNIEGFIEDQRAHLDDMYSELAEIDLEDERAIDAVMEIKKSLMLGLLDLPLRPSLCPFCIKMNYTEDGDITVDPKKCKDCEYGEDHGRCLEKKSGYAKIIKAQEALRLAVEEYWN